MTRKKRSLPPTNQSKLTKKGRLLTGKANAIVNENSDPVKLIALLIDYHRLAVKAYQNHMKVR